MERAPRSAVAAARGATFAFSTPPSSSAPARRRVAATSLAPPAKRVRASSAKGVKDVKGVDDGDEHPYHSFQAPRGITAGQPLKNLLGNSPQVSTP